MKMSSRDVAVQCSRSSLNNGRCDATDQGKDIQGLAETRKNQAGCWGFCATPMPRAWRRSGALTAVSAGHHTRGVGSVGVGGKGDGRE